MRRLLRAALAAALCGAITATTLSAAADERAPANVAAVMPAADAGGPGHQIPAGQRTTDLGGTWRFTTDPAADPADWDAMPVPGNWDQHDAYAEHQGDAWYRRTFGTPRLGSGEVARLRFEAVNYTATVTLNGRELGTHVGGYTPFEYEVGDLLKRDGTPNTLTVRANNDYAVGATWPWGGISRPVTLTVDPAVRIERQHVVAEPDLDAGTAAVTTEVTVSNAGGTERTVRVDGALTDTRGRPLPAGVLRGRDVTVPAGGTRTVELAARLPRGSYGLWSTDDPRLYRATVALRQQGRAGYAVSDRFGIRRIDIVPDGLLLNGERVRTAGFNRVPGDRVHGATEPMSVVRAEIDRMKEAGATMTRIHHVPQSPELLDYLDEVGMLNIGEISVWGKDASLDPERWRPELREMVRRDANHASVMAWSVANEIAGNTETGRHFVRSMIDYTRAELDDSRPLTYVSNTFSGIEGPEDEALQYADFLAVNLYGGFTDRVRALREHFPDKPVFVSEFSADGYTFTPDRESVEFVSRSDGAVPAQLSALPWVIGVSRWTFDDYRSRYSGTSPNQLRGWGVQTDWGGLKRNYDQMRAAYAPVAGLDVAAADGGSEITVTPRAAGELPSHILRGYRLRWKALAADGSTVARRSIPLPRVCPGDGALTRPVAGDGGGAAAGAVTEHVGLLDPQGYEVAVADRDLAAPAAPEVTQTVAAAGAVRAGFAHVAGADSYRVEAQAVTGGAVRSAVVHKDDHGDVTGLADGTAHRVRVVAVSGAGETASEWTEVTPRAGAGALPPDAQSLEPVAGGTVFQWRGVAADEAYELEVTDAAGEPVRSWTTRLRGFSRIEDLAAGTDIRVRVRSVRGDATSAWSEWTEVSTG
ncbi:glycoside hydrolase family 2 TIM barrel-domain containing protein [Streptomyces sp. B5E4]|uniref:glycoside hydrolase family 2 protein n=1 Tax=Streptomyces sp. B5E4 TaxID=3153568 RepID=UPI00325D02A5